MSLIKGIPIVPLALHHSIFPLGDSAVTIDLGNCIDDQYNTKALAIYDQLQTRRFPGLTDIIVSYSSVSLFYDPVAVCPDRTACPSGAFGIVKRMLEEIWALVQSDPRFGGFAGPSGVPVVSVAAPKGRFFRIPVCYGGEYGPDLEWVAREKGLDPGEVIRFHSEVEYRVFMIGFLPGFPYLGRTDARLQIGRKSQPVPVSAGGVGIAGFQTGVYTLSSPGGWQIIGRTPVRLFDAGTDPPVRLKAGDRVQFYPVGSEAYSAWKDRNEQLYPVSFV
ncbi:MAG TPA: 5-oxoprolinase subunit PxpB [Puia sp.]|nr:5-oxoprolinase subunit PxpB [Puia sp.]